MLKIKALGPLIEKANNTEGDKEKRKQREKMKTRRYTISKRFL